MNRRMIAPAMVVFASLVSVATVYAEVPVHSPVRAMYSNTRPVKFAVRNDSSSTVTLKAGDTEYALEPGKTKSFELQSGQQLTTKEAFSTHQPGDVIAVVTTAYAGNTLVLH